tara:strand:+ start:306 stop:1028 length:723 start_codon:yes stop_codon:yes gene_type:complete
LRKKKQTSQVYDFNDKTNLVQKTRQRKVEMIPRSLAQENYVADLCNVDTRITFALGPAGTGKTLLAVMNAIRLLKENQISRIVITRPAVSVDEQHGFLPGDLNQKMEPWTRPIMDVFEEYWNPAEIKAMIEDRVIEIAPLAYMRGRTFKDAYIVADEIQNATPSQVKMLLTRMGEGSYCSVTGDLKQHDRGFEENGLKDFVERLEANGGSHGMGITYFERRDVERDPIVQAVLAVYGEDD